MYREDVFSKVFGKSGLASKEITGVLVQTDFLDKLFSADTFFIKAYEELTGRSPAYKLATNAYDLLAGIHPSFFGNSYNPTARLNIIQQFMKRKTSDMDFISTFISGNNEVRMSHKARKVKSAYDHICSDILTAEAVEIIEAYFNKSELRKFELSDGLEVDMNKYQCVAILLSGIKRADHPEYINSKFTKEQSAMLSRYANRFHEFTVESLQEVLPNIYTIEQIEEMFNQLFNDEISYHDIDLKLLYAALFKALAHDDAQATHKICVLLKHYKKEVLKEAMTIK